MDRAVSAQAVQGAVARRAGCAVSQPSWRDRVTVPHPARGHARRGVRSRGLCTPPAPQWGNAPSRGRTRRSQAMGRAYNVIDADGHILELVDLWDNYIEPAFRVRAPRMFVDTDGKERLNIDGTIIGGPRGLGRLGGIGLRDGRVPEEMKYVEGRKGGLIPMRVSSTSIWTVLMRRFCIRASGSFLAPSTIRTSPGLSVGPIT